MAGHSKWANIKHRKAAQDKKRGKIFTRIIRELMVAAKSGGGDPNTNPSLRLAMDNARAENMPKDTMERAIKRGTGEIEGADYEEVVYEGYGPGNVAVMVKCLTDNRARTAANVRTAFNKNGGRFNETVNYMFEEKGIIFYPADVADEETMMLAAIEAGAEDVSSDENGHEIVTAMTDFGTVNNALKEQFGKAEEADLNYVANMKQPVEDEETAQKLMKFIDAVEEDDDVQTLASNADISDDIAEKVA